MDFIAIDLNKYDVWEAFRRPVPVREQSYVKTANWSPGEEVDCDSGNPHDGCFENDRRPKRKTIWRPSPSFGNYDPGSGYQDPRTDNGDGYGIGNIDHEALLCHVEQDVERELDPLARRAADLIMANSDWDDIEYGFLIYYGPNGLRLGEVERGNAVGVKIPLRLQAGETVIARVHNHPRGGIGAPSDRDRVGMDYLLENGHTDGPTFSDYIIDYDSGEFNEFDFPEDEELEEPTEETKNDAEGKC